MRMKNLRWLIVSILIIAELSMVSLSYVASFVEGRTEEFNDARNNLQIDLEVPDYWNSIKLSGKIFNFGWNLSSLAVTDEYLNAFFVVTNLPPEANILLPIGMRTGVLSFLVSQYGMINKEYNVTFGDGSVGYAYDISINPSQVQRLKLTTNNSFDLVLIFTQQRDNIYVIAYTTEIDKMDYYRYTFENILDSVKFGNFTK